MKDIKKTPYSRRFFNLMASMERFELPTVRLEGGCSIQLSYMDSISILSLLFINFN